MKRHAYIFVSVAVTLALSAGFVKAFYAGMANVQLRKYTEPAAMNAVWDWENVRGRTPQQLHDTALFLYQHQINTVFVDVSGVVGADNAPVTFDEPYVRYIETLHKRNIRVLAAAGDTTWSKPSEHWRPEAVMDYVYEFNQRYPDTKFSGIELDIEAYNQTGFASADMTEKSRVLVEYMDMVDKLATKHQKTAPNMHFGLAIPYWFDNQNKNIQSVTWQGKTGPILYHLADRLSQLPRSNLVVMAYRNASLGNDGTIAHSRTEIDYARFKASGLKIIIGQETTNVQPEKISFFVKSMPEFSHEAQTIAQTFAPSGAYGGIAINDLRGFVELQAKSGGTFGL
jgi:hypothetical protein